MTQKEALEILKMGHNAFITGAAGSGKTHLLNEYIKYLKDNGVEPAVTASTGIAATHLGGLTIHSWSGLGIRDSLSPYDIEELEEKSYLWKRFEKAKVLIIDEVSMLHHFRLDLVEKITRNFKRNNLPFGGMQVVLCGDFFQLPPVSRAGDLEAHFSYHAKAWPALDLKICYLEEQHRQNDKVYLDILNAIRKNSVSAELLGHLESRYGQKSTGAIEPTKLYSHNYNVDTENDRELDRLPGQIFTFEMTSHGKANLIETLKKGCLAPEILRLKKGSRVMFVKNNYEENYANGTLGLVEDCGNWGIKVRTTKGKIISVPLATWIIEEEGKVKAEIHQYPLRLAWAITVHKSQGMSLDAAEVDLSRSFEKGMGYVALSRVRTLEGLSLLGLNKMALQVDDEVLEYDDHFRDLSYRHTAELIEKSNTDIKKKQNEFLDKVAPAERGQSKKIKKEDTLTVTKRLVEAGKPLQEIVTTRGLTLGTILEHLEKIKEKYPDVSLRYLAGEMPVARLKKIRSALTQGGATGGRYPLTPAKEILGNKFSFEEIRLVRLLI